MSDIPNFGELLAPLIATVPNRSTPAFLARLERGAADRYRYWASEAVEYAAGLLACAAREDEIARRIDALVPAVSEDLKAIEAALPAAKDAYYGVFDGLTIDVQLAIQAGAERQGAAAWRGLAAQQADASVREQLEACAKLEEDSATYLDSILENCTPWPTT